MGSIRQSQSRQAREAAESGLSRIIEKLNSDYSYLLVGWLSAIGNQLPNIHLPWQHTQQWH